MQIQVLLFGILKDVLGRDRDALTLPEGATADALLSEYRRRAPHSGRIWSSLAIAVNQQYAPVSQVLHDGDEVALLPPVSGGNTDAASMPQIALTREPIDAAALSAGCKHAADGAVVVFDGIVRDNTRGRRTLFLDYEAYEAMALAQMQKLALEAQSRFAIRNITLVHRLGRLHVGETSVLIVVASAHRAAAFDACRWIIDTLKKTVPVWKKEHFEDGAVWADGEPFPAEIAQPAPALSGSVEQP